MKFDKVILGEGVEVTTDCKKTMRNNNIAIIGSPGSGKTMSICEARLLETYNTNLIVTLSKRKIIEKYTQLFLRRGYKVMVLDFVRPTDSNIAFDPLCYINSYADIRFLAEAIVMANPRKKNSSADPYWDDAAISLLCAEITYVLLTVKNPSFADVVALNNELEFVGDSGQIVTSLDGRIEREAKRETSPFLMTCWRTFKNLPIKTAGCVHSTLNTTLDTIFSPELLSMIKKKKKIDFGSVAAEKTILFVLTSAVNPAIHSFVNLFYGQMFKDLYEMAEKEVDGALKIPIHCICDDFACGSPVLNFAEYIAIFREKNMSVTLLLQSEQQLESLYGFEDSRTILNCCDTYIYMGGNEIMSAKSVAERCNKPLYEVLYMPIGSEIIIQRQEYPIFTTRYNILANRTYQEVTKEYEEKINEFR
ncbi:MAG: type IV secretory system conjugative DNA transfer family protein [Lachnospiraceae bacterium]|nr:type IV secretory system conjugative DNA transfer family protein [Lachnospiraceae bacterium]